jgi:DNA-binding transcriptional ArsR family regulator
VHPLAWHHVPVVDRTRDRAQGRLELRTLKAVWVARFGFPHAAQILQVTRRTRDLGTRRWRTVVVYAVTSLSHAQASPARVADLIRGHWRIENGLHHVRDVTFAEDASQVRTGTSPQVMACLRKLVVGALSRPGRSTSPPCSATTLATQPSLATLSRNGHYARTPEPCPQGWASSRAQGQHRATASHGSCAPCLTAATYNLMVVSMQTTLDFDRVFRALADATRRDIVRRAIAGEEGVAELAEHYPMSFAAVQKHVAILERAGLVTKVRTGRRKVVRTNVEGLRRARRLLDRYEELWRGRLERMAALVTDAKEAGS